MRKTLRATGKALRVGRIVANIWIQATIDTAILKAVHRALGWRS
jgi:hypothetical protein